MEISTWRSMENSIESRSSPRPVSSFSSGVDTARPPGQFVRPQNLAIDEKNQVWVADACNHRIQIFDEQGNLLRMWGEEGGEIGKLQYPYDLVLDKDGTLLISEFGSHRIQRWDRDGHSLGSWGSHGRGEGQLFNPWALVQDSTGRIHVLDTNNHRVQVVRPRYGLSPLVHTSYQHKS